MKARVLARPAETSSTSCVNRTDSYLDRVWGLSRQHVCTLWGIARACMKSLGGRSCQTEKHRVALMMPCGPK